jgi:hypothetical protein
MNCLRWSHPVSPRRPKKIGLFLVIALLPAVAALTHGGELPQRPLVGAIRWDAWYASGPVMSAVERSLGPHKYHFRLPFFARVDSPSGVKFSADAAALMDTEISLATHAGLDYWAFVDYWDDPSLTLAFRQYLASRRKGKIQFCFIEEGQRLDKVGTNGWARLVRLFQDTNYVKVLDGHPLLFIYGRNRVCIILAT